MKLKFKINKLALIRDVFVQNYYARKEQKEIPFPFWLKLEKYLWTQFRNEPTYYLINPIHHDWALNELFIKTEKKEFQKTFFKIAQVLEKIYMKTVKTKEFKRLFSETEKYKNFVEKQWKENEKLILNYFENTLGLEIPTYEIAVYIFHPKSCHGKANKQTKTIQWGHSEDWKNYTTVYLSHEIMHIITDQKCKNIKTMHALIELSIDNELRITLNKKGKYFKEGKFNIGHPYLRNLENIILPHWNNYLKNRSRETIFNLENKLQSDPKIKMEIPFSHLSKILTEFSSIE